MKKSVLLLCLLFIFGVVAGCSTPQKEEKFDYTSLPFYEQDISKISYRYENQDRVRPFWLGNVIYNEQTMAVRKNDEIEIDLLFAPEKVLAVYNWSLETKYEEGKDYILKDNELVLTEDSRIPVFDDTWAYGQNIPQAYEKIDGADVTENRYTLLDGQDEQGNSVSLTYTEGHLIYGNYIHVSYVYDPAEFDYSAVCKYENKLPLLKEKLNKQNNIKMMILGDSVSEGCSASGTWGNVPYCPFYGELVRAELERVYGIKIDLSNISVGGKTSSWGCELPQKSAIREYKPDFLVIGFGMNDFKSQVSVEKFIDNIDEIVSVAKSANENCSILLLHTFPANPKYIQPQVIADAGKEYRNYAEGEINVAYVSIFELGMNFLKAKEYYEISASNINHPNDFMHRCYAMNILCSIVDFDKIIQEEL